MLLWLKRRKWELDNFWRFVKRSDGSLAQKVARGSFWVFALRIAGGGLGVVRTVLLARFLLPHDFGLVGMTLLALSTLETFTQTGLTWALIQKKRKIEPYLDSVWSVQVMRGMVLFLVLFLTAPWIARFFNEPRIVLLMRVVSISQLFKGGVNIGVVYFSKELEFHKRFIYRLSGLLTDYGVSLLVALIWRNFWALAFGFLAGNLVSLVMSYKIHPYRPRFQLDWEKIRNLFGFGKYILGQSVVLFLLTQGSRIFVGRVLGAAALGLYQMAYMISNLPVTEITYAISEVTFPAYSRLQDETERLKRALIKTLKITSFITIPLSVGILTLAPEFTKVFLGDKWLPMVLTLQVLCLFGLMRSLGAILGPVYHALAKVNVILKINILELLILVVALFFLFFSWGILGVAIAVTLSGAVSFYLASKKMATILRIDLLHLLKPVLFFMSASMGMAALILLSRAYLFESINYFSVVFLVIIGGLSYLGLSYTILRFFGGNLGFLVRAFSQFFVG